jgi:hypothetical protein
MQRGLTGEIAAIPLPTGRRKHLQNCWRWEGDTRGSSQNTDFGVECLRAVRGKIERGGFQTRNFQR